MVPGLTERERRAADVCRHEWLAGAMVVPMRVTWGPLRITIASGPRLTLPVSVWRSGLALARVNSQWLHLIRPEAEGSLPVEAATAPTR